MPSLPCRTPFTSTTFFASLAAPAALPGLAAVAVLALLAGCADGHSLDGGASDGGGSGDAGSPTDAGGMDASRLDAGSGDGGAIADGGLDAGADGGIVDAGTDGGSDAGPDGGPDGGVCPIAMDDTVSATLRVTTDDNYILYVNGVLIDDVARIWSSPQTYTVSLYRHPGRRNDIAIEATNTAAIDGLDRGTLFELTATVDGTDVILVSDASWRYSATEVAGWHDVGFDDSAWGAATDEGAHPIAPYGAVFGTTSAHWIWSYDANVPAASKPVMETVYFRRELYFAADGTLSDAAGACP